MTSLRTLPVALLVLLAIAGCGQKGPLYLPGNPSEVQVPAAVPTEEAAEDDEEDEDAEDDGG